MELGQKWILTCLGLFHSLGRTVHYPFWYWPGDRLDLLQGTNHSTGSPEVHALRVRFSICLIYLSGTLWKMGSHSQNHYSISSPRVNKNLKNKSSSDLEDNHCQQDCTSLSFVLPSTTGFSLAELQLGWKLQSPIAKISFPKTSEIVQLIENLKPKVQQYGEQATSRYISYVIIPSTRFSDNNSIWVRNHPQKQKQKGIKTLHCQTHSNLDGPILSPPASRSCKLIGVRQMRGLE